MTLGVMANDRAEQNVCYWELFDHADIVGLQREIWN